MTATDSSPHLKKNRQDVFLFTGKLLLIWLSWKVIIYVLGVESKPINERLVPTLSIEWEYLNNEVRWMVLDGAEWVLNHSGYATDDNGYLLNIKTKTAIGLGNYCLGFQMMYYFIMLVLIAPFGWTKKVGSVMAGIAFTILLNIFRVAALCWIVAFTPDYMAISHDYIFNAVVLSALLVFYYYLVQREGN